MVGGRTYYFRVLAHGNNSAYESSDELKYFVPARVKQKAVTAGVVGGILFFIVAIILSICAVKICNKRKRRKQEKSKYSTILFHFWDSKSKFWLCRCGWFLVWKLRKFSDSRMEHRKISIGRIIVEEQQRKSNESLLA